MIKIHHVTFAATAMISGKQETSVTSSEGGRKGNTSIHFDPVAQVYLIERDAIAGSKASPLTIVHATNCRYSHPAELRSVDDYVNQSVVENSVEAVENPVGMAVKRVMGPNGPVPMEPQHLEQIAKGQELTFNANKPTARRGRRPGVKTQSGSQTTAD